MVSGKQSQYRVVGEKYSNERGRQFSCQMEVEERRVREDHTGKKGKNRNIKNENDIQYESR
jgi:hypothetical protein